MRVVKINERCWVKGAMTQLYQRGGSKIVCHCALGFIAAALEEENGWHTSSENLWTAMLRGLGLPVSSLSIFRDIMDINDSDMPKERKKKYLIPYFDALNLEPKYVSEEPKTLLLVPGEVLPLFTESVLVS